MAVAAERVSKIGLEPGILELIEHLLNTPPLILRTSVGDRLGVVLWKGFQGFFSFLFFSPSAVHSVADGVMGLTVLQCLSPVCTLTHQENTLCVSTPLGGSQRCQLQQQHEL